MGIPLKGCRNGIYRGRGTPAAQTMSLSQFIGVDHKAPVTTGHPRPLSATRVMSTAFCSHPRPGPVQPRASRPHNAAIQQLGPSSLNDAVSVRLGKLLLSWPHLPGRSQSGHISRVLSRTFSELPRILRPEGMRRYSDWHQKFPQGPKLDRWEQRDGTRPLLRAPVSLFPACPN